MSENCIAKEVEAFLLIWDAFPEPAILVGNGRKVLGANSLASDFGLRPGSTCGGLAPRVTDSALRNPIQQPRETQSALIELAEANGQAVLSYLVPVGKTTNANCADRDARKHLQ